MSDFQIHNCKDRGQNFTSLRHEISTLKENDNGVALLAMVQESGLYLLRFRSHRQLTELLVICSGLKLTCAEFGVKMSVWARDTASKVMYYGHSYVASASALPD